MSRTGSAKSECNTLCHFRHIAQLLHSKPNQRTPNHTLASSVSSPVSLTSLSMLCEASVLLEPDGMSSDSVVESFWLSRPDFRVWKKKIFLGEFHHVVLHLPLPNQALLKGSLTRYFRLQAFFMNLFPPGPWVSHWGHFKFFTKFADVFEIKFITGAPTPVINTKLLIFPRIFLTIWNGPNGFNICPDCILWGLEDTY